MQPLYPEHKPHLPPSDWDGVFTQGTFFGEEPSDMARTLMHFVRYYFNDLSALTALDLGSGSGRDTYYMAQQGIKVVSLDFSEVGVARNRERLHAQGIPQEQVVVDVCDVRDYDYPEYAFDVAMAANVFQFVPEAAPHCIPRFINTVNPGGICALGVFAPDMAGWGTDIAPYFTCTPEQILAFFDNSAWTLLDMTHYWSYRVHTTGTTGSFVHVIARKNAPE